MTTTDPTTSPRRARFWVAGAIAAALLVGGLTTHAHSDDDIEFTDVRRHTLEFINYHNNAELTPEQEAEIRKLRQQQVDARKEVRELEKDLRRDKDKIAGKIILFNIFGVPAVVTLVGIGLFAARRIKTRAR